MKIYSRYLYQELVSSITLMAVALIALFAFFDLIQELETRLATVERRAGVRAQIIREGSMDHIPEEWSENLFWIAIEALNNALKHAQARNLSVTMRVEPDFFEVRVQDDGCGFDLSSPSQPEHDGLRNMKHRLLLAGGNCEIASRPGAGTTVILRFPLPNRADFSLSLRK